MKKRATKTELAWAAGFFDGEGSIHLGRNKVIRHDRPGTPVYYSSTPTLSIAQVDRRVLDRFVKIVGHGKVRGPYQGRSANSRPYHRVAVEGRDRVCAIIRMLWPYLGEVKKQQARDVWAKERKFRGPKSPPMPTLPED